MAKSKWIDITLPLGKEIPVLPIDEARRVFEARMANLPADGPSEGSQRLAWVMEHVMEALRGKTAGATVCDWVREVLS